LEFKALLVAASVISLCGCGLFSNDDAAARQAREWSADAAVSAEALKAAVKDEDVRRFYEARQWAAVWDKDHAAQLTGALALARRHALDHIAFLPKTAPDEPAAREIALTRAALDYAKALAQGMVDPGKLWPIYTLPRPKAELADGLNGAARQGKIGEWLESLAPQTEEYRALSAAYVEQLQNLAAAPAVRGGGLIKAGMSDPRVPALAQALQANGYLAEKDAKSDKPELYSPAILAAVKALQANYGIEDDGVVGPDTLEVLNTGPADRARQLAVNLERRRWLNRNPPATRIDVNTAATFLQYWRDGALRDQRRVVVGQPDWETPQLFSPIVQLVANPTWNVPKSIEAKEIAPKGEGYLAANNMVRKNGRIVQLSGPDNSLGLVKFDMENDHAIYLHDTPAKALFGVNERHRSHGCIRVENAVGFAEMLAGDDGVAAQFQQALTGGKESFVKLKRQVPVRLLYHTAFLDGGTLRLQTDAYGWDDDVANALHLPKRTRRVLRSQGGDVGP
jgi:murein L,D-transpeptidase YcbB/YkuD